MPVICARYVSHELRRAAKQTYHHDECAPVEEAAVYVRNEADRERAHCSRDVALVAEARAGEVVRHPADARDGHEEVLQEDAIAIISTEEARSELDCSAYQFSAVPRRVLPQAQEEGV